MLQETREGLQQAQQVYRGDTLGYLAAATRCTRHDRCNEALVRAEKLLQDL